MLFITVLVCFSGDNTHTHKENGSERVVGEKKGERKNPPTAFTDEGRKKKDTRKKKAEKKTLQIALMSSEETFFVFLCVICF